LRIAGAAALFRDFRLNSLAFFAREKACAVSTFYARNSQQLPFIECQCALLPLRITSHSKRSRPDEASAASTKQRSGIQPLGHE
jgi:hypothetical protein